MAEVGILAPDARVQLLCGIIYDMPPVGPGHAEDNQTLDEIFKFRLPRKLVQVRDQKPIRLDNMSEPEPDVAVVKRREGGYRDRHPRPDEVLLLVEVADSTLNFDKRKKQVAYAQAGIVEYWVLDVQARVLHNHRNPRSGGYEDIIEFRAGDVVSPTRFPELELTVSELLGV